MSDTIINPATSFAHLEFEAATLEAGKSEGLAVAGQLDASFPGGGPTALVEAFLLLVKKQLRSVGECSLDQISIHLNGRLERNCSSARYAIRAGQRAATVSISLHTANTASSNNSFQHLVDSIFTIDKALDHRVRVNNHQLYVTVRYKGALSTLTAAEANGGAADVARAYMQLRAATAPYL